MSKYKSVLVSQIQERRVEEKKQSELKNKYGIDKKENVVVVEKNHWLKFIIRFTENISRILVQIIILVFATIGLMTLVYPELREPFLQLIISIKNEFIFSI